jgi:5-(aminomethyl)-3-furanmethanol phosphate kinase
MCKILVKVGGSLLGLPDLGIRLHGLAEHLSADQVLFFPGGGPTANLVRDWHSRFQFDEEAAHQLAVRSLRLNAELLARLMPEVPLGNGYEKSRMMILDPVLLLDRYDSECPDDAPPHTWDVTSDSLAAWIALRWPTEDLLLLKSVPCPIGQTVTAASRIGLVDPYFPGLAGRIPRVSWCCLRDDNSQAVPWLRFGEPL